MPELPEVESSRKFVHNLCSGCEIIRLTSREIGGGPRDGLFDDLVFEGGPDEEMKYRDALLGKTLSAVKRKGKQMWFEMKDSDTSILFHFGMTGSFAIKDNDIPQYTRNKYDGSHWPPRFTKLEMEFSNGLILAFCDPRRLGRIKLRTDPLNTPPLSKLGLDPVNDALPTSDELKNILKPFSAPIKAVLLDQDKVFCGIGNYLADEILYQAGIYPGAKTNSINTLGLEKVLESMRSIFKIAVEADARYEQFPKEWLFHYRWDKGKNERAKMPDGNLIVYETHGGRTTAVVPKQQPRFGIYYKDLEKDNNKLTTTPNEKKKVVTKSSIQKTTVVKTEFNNTETIKKVEKQVVEKQVKKKVVSKKRKRGEKEEVKNELIQEVKIDEVVNDGIISHRLSMGRVTRSTSRFL